NTNAAAPTDSAATTLTRNSTVGHAWSTSRLQNGHGFSAGLFERTCCARLTPRKKWPEPQYSGTNQSTGISANKPITSLRAPGSLHHSQSPYGPQNSQISGRSSAAKNPTTNACLYLPSKCRSNAINTRAVIRPSE